MQIGTNMQNIAQSAWLKALITAKVIVDATAGTGKDTLFLAENMNVDAHIYTFDVQPVAMVETKKLTQSYADKISYLLDSHENISQVVTSDIDLVVFNLGYLPGGNHQITTVPEVTLKAVMDVLKKLSVNGLLSIMVYPGHASGREEAEILAPFLEDLPVDKYTTGCYKLVNHGEDAPFLYLIEKVKG